MHYNVKVDCDTLLLHRALQQSDVKSATTKSNKCSLFSTLREPSVSRKDLRALALVGPTRNNAVLDPRDEIHLYN